MDKKYRFQWVHVSELCQVSRVIRKQLRMAGGPMQGREGACAAMPAGSPHLQTSPWILAPGRRSCASGRFGSTAAFCSVSVPVRAASFQFQGKRKKESTRSWLLIQNRTVWLTAGINLFSFSFYRGKIPSSSLDALLSAARTRSKLNGATIIGIYCSTNDRFRGTGFTKKKKKKGNNPKVCQLC